MYFFHNECSDAMSWPGVRYWGILAYTGVHRGIQEYTVLYWSLLEIQAYTGVYWGILGNTGVYLFHNECSDAMFFGSHVSFSIDDENVGVWSVSDPELTAIENIVVT